MRALAPLRAALITHRPLSPAPPGTGKPNGCGDYQPLELVTELGLDPTRALPCRRSAFRLRVPRAMLPDPRGTERPLLRQSCHEAELATPLNTPPIPLGARSIRARATQKYTPGVANHYLGCAVHCRYCFRREFRTRSRTSESRGERKPDEISRDTSIENHFSA